MREYRAAWRWIRGPQEVQAAKSADEAKAHISRAQSFGPLEWGRVESREVSMWTEEKEKERP